MTGIAALSERWAKLDARLPADVRSRALADARVVRLPGNVPPWTDTGLRIARGDEVTILAEGKIVTSPEAGLWYRPRFALWARVGERGPIWTGTRDTQSFRASSDGALELAVYNGEWKSPDGCSRRRSRRTRPPAARSRRWSCTGAARRAPDSRRLERAAPGEPLIAAELERLRAPALRPGGWSYLWFLGQSEMFRAARDDGRHQIACRCDDDVAILRRPVDLPLAADTEISWRWKIDRAPVARRGRHAPVSRLPVGRARVRERPRSVLVLELEPAGRDAASPVRFRSGTRARRTSRCARAATGWDSGSASGARVVADYARAIGGPAPKRIVAVWLIAVSLFQHGQGVADFAEIEVRTGDERVEVVNG